VLKHILVFFSQVYYSHAEDKMSLNYLIVTQLFCLRFIVEMLSIKDKNLKLKRTQIAQYYEEMSKSRFKRYKQRRSIVESVLTCV